MAANWPVCPLSLSFRQNHYCGAATTSLRWAHSGCVAVLPAKLWWPTTLPTRARKWIFVPYSPKHMCVVECWLWLLLFGFHVHRIGQAILVRCVLRNDFAADKTFRKCFEFECVFNVRIWTWNRIKVYNICFGRMFTKYVPRNGIWKERKIHRAERAHIHTRRIDAWAHSPKQSSPFQLFWVVQLNDSNE